MRTANKKSILGNQLTSQVMPAMWTSGLYCKPIDQWLKQYKVLWACLSCLPYKSSPKVDNPWLNAGSVTSPVSLTASSFLFPAHGIHPWLQNGCYSCHPCFWLQEGRAKGRHSDFSLNLINHSYPQGRLGNAIFQLGTLLPSKNWDTEEERGNGC